jgi:hypothetical protein
LLQKLILTRDELVHHDSKEGWETQPLQ